MRKVHIPKVGQRRVPTAFDSVGSRKKEFIGHSPSMAVTASDRHETSAMRPINTPTGSKDVLNQCQVDTHRLFSPTAYPIKVATGNQ